MLEIKAGKNLKVGRFVVADEDVRVGDNVTIGNFVYLMAGTVIGDNCVIGEYVRTGKDCRIGDNVTIKCRATISPKTKIGNDVFIGPHAMILHALPDGSHVPSTVQDKAYLGACSLVGPNVIIGEGVILGAMAFALRDCVEPGGLYVGIPAKLRGR
jgi:acetyltransferase-like isoleucine patch superfamily enzyme